MNVLDIVLAVLALIAVIIGLKRGFAKMITSVLCIIIALAGAVVVSLLLVGVIQKLPFFVSLQQMAQGWFGQEIMVAPFTTEEELTALLSAENAGVLGVLKGIAPSLFGAISGITVISINTLGGYVGFLIITIIFGFVIWLVAYLIIKYLLLGIKKLLLKLSKVPVLRSLDKISGVVCSVVVTYLLVFGIAYNVFLFVCAKWFPALGGDTPSFGDNVLNLINSSTIFKYVHGTNFIGELVGGYLGLDFYNLIPIV